MTLARNDAVAAIVALQQVATTAFAATASVAADRAVVAALATVLRIGREVGTLPRAAIDPHAASNPAAAAVVAGRSANGRTSWIDTSMGMNFGEWQRRGIGDDTFLPAP